MDKMIKIILMAMVSLIFLNKNLSTKEGGGQLLAK